MRRLAFVLALVLLSACGGQDERENVVDNPPTEGAQKVVTGLTTLCWNGFRIFFDEYGNTYYGRSIAVIADPECK